MGMGLQVHFGPYIYVDANLTEPVTKVKRQCPAHPKIKQDNNKFCPTCGATVVNVDEVKYVDVNPGDIVDWDKLSPPHQMRNILLPQDLAPNEIKFDTDDYNEIDLSNIEVIKSEQIDWFMAEYAAEIIKLYNRFGSQHVHVKWGVISYWS